MGKDRELTRDEWIAALRGYGWLDTCDGRRDRWVAEKNAEDAKRREERAKADSIASSTTPDSGSKDD